MIYNRWVYKFDDSPDSSLLSSSHVPVYNSITTNTHTAVAYIFSDLFAREFEFVEISLKPGGFDRKFCDFVMS